MIYAQIKGGNKLHLVEEHIDNYGGGKSVGQPLCGIVALKYRMTINLPLGNACKNCQRVFNARASKP